MRQGYKRATRYLRAGLTIGSLLMGGLVTTTVIGLHAAGAAVGVSGTTKVSTLDTPDPDVVYSGSGTKYYAYATGTNQFVTPTTGQPVPGSVPAVWTTLHGRGTIPAGGISITPLSCTKTGCAITGVTTVALRPANIPSSITLKYGLQAPSVANLGSHWVMYYGARNVSSGQAFAIYDATSPSPTTGFHTPSTRGPIMYQGSTGGSTDPSVLIDNSGNPWLQWKSSTYTGDGVTANLWSILLAATGLHTTGGAHILISQPTTTPGLWDRATIENPDMIYSGGTYYLFYSGGLWGTPTYSEGYVTCSAATGGCGSARWTSHEVLHNTTSAPYGPGGASLFTATTGNWLMAYHGWNLPCTNYFGFGCGASRQLYVNKVSGLSPTTPSISSFTASATTLPATGGNRTVTLTASATGAVSYTFSSSPGPTGLPAWVNTTSGTATATVHIPANTSSSPVHYTFAVTATGPYGGQASKGTSVTVAADPPSITSFSPSFSYLPSVGGTETFTLAGQRISSYQISSTPPLSIPANTAQISIPQNLSGSPAVYTFTVTATNSGGSTTSSPVTVTVARPEASTMAVRSSGEEDVAVVTAGGQLDYYWNLTDTPMHWHMTNVANSISPTSTPVLSIKSTGEAVIAAVTSGGQLNSYWQASDTSPLWTSAIVTTSIPTTSMPSMVVRATGEEDIAVVNSSGQLNYYWNFPTAQTHWSGENVTTSMSPTSTPVLAVKTAHTTGEETIAAVTSGGQLNFYWQASDTAGHWAGANVTSSIPTNASPSMSVRSSGEEDIAVVNSSGQLNYYWNLSDASMHWNGENVTTSMSPTSTPVLAVKTAHTTGEETIAAVASNGQLNFYWQASDTAGHWAGANVTSSIPTNASPSMSVRSSGEEDIAVVNSSGQLNYYWNLSDASMHWNGENVTTSMSPTSTPVLAVKTAHTTGEETIAAVTSGGQLNFYWQASDTAGHWAGTNVTPAISSGSTSTMAVRSSGEEDVAVVTAGGQLDYYWNLTDTPMHWHMTNVASSISPTSTPVLSIKSTGEAVIAAVTSGGQLNSYWQASDTSPLWTSAIVTTSIPTTSMPSMVVRATGEEDIAVVNSSGQLNYYWNFPTAQTHWSGENVTTSMSPTSTPVLAVKTAHTPGEETIAAVTSGGQLNFYWQASDTAGHWAGANVTSSIPTNASPSMSVRSSGEEDIAVVNSSGQLNYYWNLSDTSMHWNGQNVTTSMSPTSTPVLAVKTAHTPGEETIAAVTSGGQLNFYWQASDTAGHWAGANVTSSIPTNASPSMSVRSSGEEDIAVVNSSGQLNYYWNLSDASMHWNGENAGASISPTSTPVLAVKTAHTPGEETIAAVASNGQLNFYWQASDTAGHWAGTNVVGF